MRPTTWQLGINLGNFFAAFERYVKSLVLDNWIWGEYLSGKPCIVEDTLDEHATQVDKDEIVADIFANYEGVVKCHEWVQMARYTTIDGIELEGPVNVLVQTWNKPQELAQSVDN